MRDLWAGKERERGVGMDREGNRSRRGSGGVFSAAANMEREAGRSRGGSGGAGGKGGGGLRLVGREREEDWDPRDEIVGRRSGDSGETGTGRVRVGSGE